MQPADAALIVARLVASFPNANVRAETIAIYADMIRDLEATETSAAVAQILGTAKYFPSIAEIRTAVIERRCGFPSVESALVELRKNLDRAGPYIGQTQWSHPLLRDAAEAVGWHRLSNGDNPSADFAQFAKTYAEMRTQVVRAQNLASAGLLRGPALPFGEGGRRLPETTT